jgi:hypothetical protein
MARQGEQDHSCLLCSFSSSVFMDAPGILAETRTRISGWFASLLTPMKTPLHGGRMDTYFEHCSATSKGREHVTARYEAERLRAKPAPGSPQANCWH